MDSLFGRCHDWSDDGTTVGYRGVRMIDRSSRRSQSGFSLLEVMISLLVIAIGLLGVAKTQALAIGNTKTAGSRSLAALHAASIASAMHANKGYWASGLAPASLTISNTTVSDATLNGQSVDCTASSCTSLQLAGYDLKTIWGPAVQQQLPGGTGTIACSNAVGVAVTCTVTVNWNEKYIGLNQATVDTSKQTSIQSVALLVEP